MTIRFVAILLACFVLSATAIIGSAEAQFVRPPIAPNMGTQACPQHYELWHLRCVFPCPPGLVHSDYDKCAIPCPQGNEWNGQCLPPCPLGQVHTPPDGECKLFVLPRGRPNN